MDKKVSNAIAVIITLVWATSFVADIAVAEYSPSPFVHMIMMGLAGATFGQGFIKTIANERGIPAPPPGEEPVPREPTKEEVEDAAREWLRKSIDGEGRKGKKK